MEAVYNQAQMQQQHRRGPIMRYNSIDYGLLGSPYDPSVYMYTNTSFVRPNHYQQSHRLVQLQRHPQSVLLPLPIAATRPQHSSLPLRTCSVKLNRVTRKHKSHESAGGNPKSNYQKKVSSSCLKEQLVSKKMSRPGQSANDVSKNKLDRSKEIERAVSDLEFTQSPHPSSLPLPKFFMRQRAGKHSCKVEANTGASASDDGLRRVLQLP